VKVAGGESRLDVTEKKKNRIKKKKEERGGGGGKTKDSDTVKRLCDCSAIKKWREVHKQTQWSRKKEGKRVRP